MKFNIDAIEFQKTIKNLSTVAKTNTEDITGRIFVNASDKGITFIANNGFMGIVCDVKTADVVESGNISMVFGDMYKFVMSFKPWDGKSGTKSFCVYGVNNNVKIEVESFQVNGSLLKGELLLPPAENSFGVFNVPDVENGSFMMNSTLFKNALNKTLYAVDSKHVNFSLEVLKGLNLRFGDDNIYFAGSNGIVLAEYKIKNVTDYKDTSLILYYDFAASLKRIITDDKQMIWEIKDNVVGVRFDNILFYGKRIIGLDYPNYGALIDNFTKSVSIDKNRIIDTILPLLDILDKEDNYRLTLEIKKGVIRFYNENAYVEVEIDVDDIEFVIDLNGRLLSQSVDTTDDQVITLNFSDSTGPFIIKGASSDNQTVVITPIMRRV
jgi:DNA polymerase III sliding clamp (beta) subunit (PCNA family)